jgi:hypothetical protein
MVSASRRILFATLITTAVMLAFSMPGLRAGQAQPKKDDKAERQQQERLQRARSQEIMPLVKQLDSMMSGTGQAAPQDFAVVSTADFVPLPPPEQRVWVPLTLSFPKDAVTSNSVALYIRLAPKGATGATEAPGAEGEKRAAPAAAPRYPWEDMHFVDLKPGPTGYRFSRGMIVLPGEYDLYLALKERNKKEGAKTTFVKQDLSVPNYATEFTTSSVIVADRMDQLQQPVPADQQVMRPYALGSIEIVPAEDMSFAKSATLSLIFTVCNAALAPDQKPNVQVDYAFFSKAGGAEKYFNKTQPQQYNAQTLPPDFSFATGHQLVATLDLPLTPFPEGDYRLEIKVTDKTSGKSLTRNVNFTVAPA